MVRILGFAIVSCNVCLSDEGSFAYVWQIVNLSKSQPSFIIILSIYCCIIK
jgi:hypothetical protein